MLRYLLAGLFFIGCAGTPPDRGTWSGTWQGQPVIAEWTPAQPRIGDSVNLTLRFPQGLPEARLLGGLPSPLLSEPGTLQYRHLVRRPGAFQPENFSTPLWTVQPAKEEPWVHMSTRAVFTPLPWSPWLWTLLPLLTAPAGFLLWRYLSRRPAGINFRRWKKSLSGFGEPNPRILYKELQHSWEASGLNVISEGDAAFWERLQRVLYSSLRPSKTDMLQDLDHVRQRLKEGGGV